VEIVAMRLDSNVITEGYYFVMGNPKKGGCFGNCIEILDINNHISLGHDPME
jgi:hypothetical protein